MIIAATGHRPDKSGGYGAAADQRRRDLAFDYLAERRPRYVISGMALGWDTAFAEAAYNLGIPFVAAVPFRGQDSRWPEHSRQVFRALLAVAAEVVIVSPGLYTAYAMHRRNEWMVDRCDRVCALWDGSDGGTGSCLKYARKMGKPIDNVWPAAGLIDSTVNNKVSCLQQGEHSK